MLCIQNISKQYQTGDLIQKALDGVSLCLRDSEFVSILGPSGSGKTTLLNIIGGLDRYDSGDLIINGKSTGDYRDRDWDAYRNHSVGFIFQSYNLIPHQTILSNVELTLTLGGLPKEERRQRAMDALRRVGLGDQVHKKPSQLSGGQMQRVAIARALVNDPDIVLADEPTGALDSDTSVQVMELLREVARDRLVVMVTHNAELAEEYSTRIVNLKDGKIVSDTDPFHPDAGEKGRRTDSGKPMPSMRFATAFSLSLQNLWTKKTRTILVAAAGSIGIIGIALILSLAAGADNYIRYIEEDTLSEYPLEITASGYDISGISEDMEEAASEYQTAGKEPEEETDPEIEVGSVLTGVFSTADANDLASLKEYFDSEESGIAEYVTYIEYGYDITPYIYQRDDDGSVRQVNPNTTFSSLQTGSASDAASAISEIMGTLVSMDIFYQLPSEDSLYLDKYDLRAGRWPDSYDECVIVLNTGGTISDYMLYILGLRDSYELEEMISQYLSGSSVDTPTEMEGYTPEDLLDISFLLIEPSDLYVYDEELGIWSDRSASAEHLSALSENAQELKVVGVVEQKDADTVSFLSPGIYYTEELTAHIVDYAQQSEIVQQQMDHPEINVFTGKAFGDTDTQIDMESLISVDYEAVNAALSETFSLDSDALLSDEDYEALLAGAFSLQDDINIDLGSMLNLSSLLTPASIEVDVSDYIGLLTEAEDAFADTAQEWEALKEDLSVLCSLLMTDFQNYLIAQGAEDVSSLSVYYAQYLESGSAAAIWEAWSAACLPSQAFPQTLQEDLETFLSDMVNTCLEKVFAGYASSVEILVQRQMRTLSAQLSDQIYESMQTGMAEVLLVMEESLSDALSDQISLEDGALSEILSGAVSLNMDSDELTDLLLGLSESADASYADNLIKLGYADLSAPSSITIYPKNFAGKDAVKEIIADYNEQMTQQGEEEKVISYTDLVGTLTGSVTEIINIISYLLIAFVGISLVVSSIMIGVITYISVLERRKEIGVLRAIGSSRRNISEVFNAETCIIGLLAGLIGVIVSEISLLPINILIHRLAGNTLMNAVLLPYQAAALVLLSVALTLIGGMIPSQKASRCDPVAALRAE